MVRCDFVSIMAAIRSYVSESRGLNQTNFLYLIFESFISSSENMDFDFDNGLVCRWLKGSAKVSPKISSYYLKDKRHRIQMEKDIYENILPIMSDSAMAAEEIYNLILRDDSISERKKRDAKTTALIATGSLSPAVSNFIFGNDVPKPCRHFCGRDSEIEKLHNLLEEHGKIFLHGIAGIGKSELAKAYASRYKKEYTNILYIVYSGDLKRDITDLDFSDDLPDENREERFRRHNRFLRTLKQDAYRTLRTGEKYCKGNPPGKRCPCYAYRN